MRPEDVPDEWVDIAWHAYDDISYDLAESEAVRAALAAVAPLIAAAEREACAEIAFDEYLAASNDDEDPDNNDFVARLKSQGAADGAARIRNAIRARS